MGIFLYVTWNVILAVILIGAMCLLAGFKLSALRIDKKQLIDESLSQMMESVFTKAGIIAIASALVLSLVKFLQA